MSIFHRVRCMRYLKAITIVLLVILIADSALLTLTRAPAFASSTAAISASNTTNIMNSTCTSLKMAPLNPDFLKYMNGTKAGTYSYQTASGNFLGNIPAPVNLSYMKGIQLNFTQGQASYPSSYDLRNTGKVTSVKDQGPIGTCWAFATYGSLESYLLPLQTWDFSENNLKNTHGFDWPYYAGGNEFISTAYLTRWGGPINEAADPYDPYSGVSPPNLPIQKHVQDVLFIPDRAGPLDNDNIKAAIATYGGIYSGLSWSDACYDSAHSTFYNPGTVTENHAITLVGWDDNFDWHLFNPPSGQRPPANGAFIAKNSWGTSFGDDGYFYISYYDNTIGTDNTLFTAEPLSDYTGEYQYDRFGWIEGLGYTSTTGWSANIFTATSNDLLSAVSFYTVMPGTQYDVYVYTDPNSGPINTGGYAGRKTGTMEIPGYHTIALDSIIPISAGHRFSAVVKVTTPGYNYPIALQDRVAGYTSSATGFPGVSFISPNGASWQDVTLSYPNAVACIKAFTSNNAIPMVTSVSPASGAVNVPVTTLVKATFNKAMNASTINSSTFLLYSGGSPLAGSVVYYPANLTAVFTPALLLLSSTSYTVNVTAGVMDTVGNNMAADRVWSFTTMYDPHPNANYVSDTIPSSLVIGSPYSVNVTMRNTGNLNWTAADNFRLGGIGDASGDAAKFGPLRVNIAPGIVVHPGERYTFIFTMTAPGTAGTYHPSYRMVWEGHQWFGDTLTKTVTVATVTPNAVYVSDTVPPGMLTGIKYNVSITMRNTGGVNWTAADLFRLGAIGDAAGDAGKFGPLRINIAPGIVVHPGESYTFNFTMTAPNTAATYHPAYRMVWDGHQWFGDTVTKTIVVSVAVPNAAFVSDTIPISMARGGSYPVSITMRNSGNANWTAADNFRLGGVGDASGDAGKFGVLRVSISPGIVVQPGQSYTFSFTMTAPGTAGTYHPAYRMVWDGHQWFGETDTKTISVT
jgi:C1A family cysteine protease